MADRTEKEPCTSLCLPCFERGSACLDSVMVTCGPTTGCGKLFHNNLPNCPHCGKVNFGQHSTFTFAHPVSTQANADVTHMSACLNEWRRVALSTGRWYVDARGMPVVNPNANNPDDSERDSAQAEAKLMREALIRACLGDKEVANSYIAALQPGDSE